MQDKCTRLYVTLHKLQDEIVELGPSVMVMVMEMRRNSRKKPLETKGIALSHYTTQLIS